MITSDTSSVTTSEVVTKSDYVKYLNSYESMVRQQDLEFEATSEHVQLIFRKIQTLGCSSSSSSSKKTHLDDDGGVGVEDHHSSEENNNDTAPSGMLTYLQIRRCLLRMGIGWKRCVIPPNSNNSRTTISESEYDDDVSVLSFNSTSSWHSGISGGGMSGGGGGAPRGDIIATDAQLIMLLTTLVEMEERYRASRIIMRDEEGGGDESDELFDTPSSSSRKNNSNNKKIKYQLDQGIFLPEFIQCYELIIGGMNSLKCVTTSNPTMSSSNSTTESTTTTLLCNRLKDRTMGMLKPFGPDSKMYSNKTSSPIDNKTMKSGSALSPQKGSLRSTVKGGGNSGGSVSKKRPRSGFSNGEMKKVMRSKDRTLAKIMEDHELEMNVLAVNMEELRLQEQRARNILRKRRKRITVIGIVFIGVLVTIGMIIETRRREFLENEITMGREAERRADLAIIAQLNEQKSELEKRLGVLEGKTRYQINRNNDIEAQTNDIEKRIEDVDVKWLMDKAETERCFVSQVQMNEELEHQKLRVNELNEEAVWCRSRLRSQEMELNELEHVSEKPSRNSRELIDTKSNGRDSFTKTGNNKPVYLEMKFNKSIRNAMILRQVYSAASGLAVSILLRGMVPFAFKLFMPKKIVLPPPTVVPDYQRAEMAIVDGIFGSSVAFLLVRAIVTFITPL